MGQDSRQVHSVGILDCQQARIKPNGGSRSALDPGALLDPNKNATEHGIGKGGQVKSQSQGALTAVVTYEGAESVLSEQWRQGSIGSGC